MAIVFLIPKNAEFTVWVVELRQRALFLRSAERLWPHAPGAVMGKYAMCRDSAEPTTEGTAPLALESRQFADQDLHHFLDNILGLGAEFGIAQQPALDQRPIDVV